MLLRPSTCFVAIVLAFVWTQVLVRSCAAAATAAAAAAGTAAATAHVAVVVQSGRWSSPGVWRHRRPPAPGDAVEIASGATVLIDANATISRLLISGTGTVLSCLPNDQLAPETSYINLTLELLLVQNGGCFSCGAGACRRTGRPEPYAGRLTISLASHRAPLTANENVRTVLVQDGGSLHLSGLVRTTGVTRLARHALAGSASIVVSNPRVATAVAAEGGWEPGGLIAIAPTDYDPGQTEYRRIVSVSKYELRGDDSGDDDDAATTTAAAAALIVLDAPLAYAHNGHRLRFASFSRSQTTAAAASATLSLIDTRAEVALLSRNIVVEGVFGEPRGLGGDVKITGENSSARIEWCEFRFLGRRGHLGRYPLHMHGVGGGGGGSRGDGGSQVYISNVAIHESYQRGVVLHCTNNAQVLDSIVAGAYGFAYMLEDGAEEDNVLSGNLALDINNALPDPGNSVLTEHANPAAFWFVNPANTFIGNSAAGVRGAGFSWEMIRNRTASYTLCPQRVPGYDLALFESRQYEALDNSVYGALMRKNIAAFKNNSVHSMLTGLWFHGGWNAKANHPERQSFVEDFVAWKLQPRQGMPVGLAGANHDGCIHVSDLTQLVFRRVACINSPSAFWSMESNVVDVALLAWVSDTGSTAKLVPSGVLASSTASVASAPNAKALAWVVYADPQAFLNVHVSGIQAPIFQARGTGSLASANSIVAGFSYDAGDSVSLGQQERQLLITSARALHVFTDADGSLLGAGPGSRVLSSCSGCADRPDPIIEAYAPNACKPLGRKTKPDANADGDYVSGPLSKGVIRGIGATPILCPGPTAPAFSVVRIALRSSAASLPRLDLHQLHVFSAFEATAATATAATTPRPPQYLRSVNATAQSDGYVAWFIMPLTESSMSPAGGYRVVSSTGWRGVQEVVIECGPTARPGQGLSIVLSWVPSSFILTSSRAGANVDQRREKEDAVTTDIQCAEYVHRACLETTTPSSSGSICACQSSQGHLFVRFASADVAMGTAYDAAGKAYLHPTPGLKLVFKANR